MKSSWDLRIARAGELLGSNATVSELLVFYRTLVQFQRGVFESLLSTPSNDVAVLLPHFPALLGVIQQAGSPALKVAAGAVEQSSGPERVELLTAFWQHQSTPAEVSAEYEFFARALLQPFAEALAKESTPNMESSSSTCPFCGSAPQVAVLRSEGDGGKRSLVCSLCSTEWNFRRVLCPNCGEENKDKLPIYMAEEFDYVRVDACDTCRAYIKSIDMTKNGRAVPVVDELATLSLNLWAEQNHYHKLKPNLFGV